MCMSAAASFTVGTLLITGSAVAGWKTAKTDKRYMLMALFPLLVGIQQYAEGFVWIGLTDSNETLITAAAFSYLFFVWVIWPFWVPLMTWAVEKNRGKQTLILTFSISGLIWGLFLYFPYIFNPEWLAVTAEKHAIVYQTTLLPDQFLPRPITYMIYLALIGIPPLLSSYAHMNIFGLALIVAVPLTYFYFLYAHISMLCFLAAILTLYLINIIWRDKCGTGADKSAPA